MHARILLSCLAAILVLPLPALAFPTPGLNGATTEAIPVVGRLFPEALHTNDYIGYFEAIPSLNKLNTTYPDTIEVIKIGKSRGWVNAQTQQREPHDVYVIEVTNEKSPIPFGEKIQLVFTCSIHGNEKGGREGCLRVIEDFAKGIGLAAERPALKPLLDYMVLSFTIPNTDGWTHDELQYYASSPSSMYTRGNANGTDLNRNWPTIGYLEATNNHKTMNEPEIAAAARFLVSRYPNVWYAVDIHGMLTPADAQGAPPVPGNCGPSNPGACPATATAFQQWLQKPNKGHFLLGLLSSAQLTQDDFVRQTRMAELIREKTQSCPGTLGPTWCMAPSIGSWGGAYSFWGTSWETIGYTSSGSTSNFMMSPTGLNAPAATYEMAYNHQVCDGIYAGCGAYMNEFHVHNVRRIVEALMEAARTDFRVSLETGGAKTAYVFNPKVTTTADENGKPKGSGGWSDQTPLDDRWDTLHNAYTASAIEYLRDLRAYVREGDKPGVFDEVRGAEITPARLQAYDTLIVAGSAHQTLPGPAKDAIRAWTEAGGLLVVTDSSMVLAEEFGALKAGSLRNLTQYVGMTDVVDFSHPLAKNLLGYSRQTYDPVSIGYRQGAAPVWFFDRAEASAKGNVVGVLRAGSGSAANSPNANLGELKLGEGLIRYLGALLPDPSSELYTPYGIADYGVTYAGNQFFVNLLGFNLVFEAPPKVLDADGGLARPANAPVASPASGGAEGSGDGPSAGTPGPGIALAVLVLALTAAATRRRR